MRRYTRVLAIRSLPIDTGRAPRRVRSHPHMGSSAATPATPVPRNFRRLVLGFIDAGFIDAGFIDADLCDQILVGVVAQNDRRDLSDCHSSPKSKGNISANLRLTFSATFEGSGGGTATPSARGPPRAPASSCRCRPRAPRGALARDRAQWSTRLNCLILNLRLDGRRGRGWAGFNF